MAWLGSYPNYNRCAITLNPAIRDPEIARTTSISLCQQYICYILFTELCPALVSMMFDGVCCVRGRLEIGLQEE